MIKENKSKETLKELYENEPFGSFVLFLEYLVGHPKITEGYSKDFKTEIIEKCKEEITTNPFIKFEKVIALANRFRLPKQQLNEVYEVKLEKLLDKINRWSREKSDWYFKSMCGEAGDLAEKIGNLELAIENHKQAEQYYNTARCLEKGGDNDKALEYYLKGGSSSGWKGKSLRRGLSLAKKQGNEQMMLNFYEELIKEWNYYKEPDADEFDTNYNANDIKRALRYRREAEILTAKLKVSQKK